MSDAIERTYAEAVKGIEEAFREGEDGWFKGSRWYNYITSLSEPQRVVYTIIVLDDQVTNGGFDQYFVNGYGQFAPEAIESLKKIGATETARLVEKALAIVNYKNLEMEAFRRAVQGGGTLNKLYETDELGGPLDELDHKYYNSEEDLEGLLNRYLASQSP